MKKEYRKPTVRFHELKCNVMVPDSLNGVPEPPAKVRDASADEWSD